VLSVRIFLQGAKEFLSSSVLNSAFEMLMGLESEYMLHATVNICRPHSKVTKKVVHPKIVSSGQAVLSSQQPPVPSAPSDIAVVAAAAAAASAVAATQPLLKVEKDAQLFNRIKLVTFAEMWLIDD
jgi:hypothetical protein